MAFRPGVHKGRRVVAGAATVGALVVGLAISTVGPAAADPADSDAGAASSAAEAPQKREMTADEALALIAQEYDTGAGGGQVSNLIHDVLVLRQQGYRPSNANRKALVKGLEKRPHQTPLVEALRNTLAHQRKLQARGAAAQVPQSGLNPGIGQFPAGIAPVPGGGGQPGPSAGILLPVG